MYLKIKRVLDIAVVLLLSPLWLPVMGVLALLIKVSSKGPIFFMQQRIGRNHRLFYMYKFRSMHIYAPRDVPTHLMKSPGQYITTIGRFLRKSSMDELPQIINIIRGELSLIGPRPALWNQDDLIAEREKYGANKIPVGLTGLAQVKGRDDLSLEMKASYDGEYAKTMSLWLDICILFRTVGIVLLGRGAK